MMKRDEALALLAQHVNDIDERQFHHPQPDYYTYLDFPHWTEYIIHDGTIRSRSIDEPLREIETPAFTHAYNYNQALNRCASCGELYNDCSCDGDIDDTLDDDENGESGS